MEVKHVNPKGPTNFCFTLNNYTPDEVRKLNELKCRYLVYGYEVAPTTGTPHLQCYLELNDEKTKSALNKSCGNRLSDIEERYGTQEQAINYCKKDGNFVERGTPKKQGKRTDIRNVLEVVKNGGNMRQVCETSTGIQSIKIAEVYLKYFEPPRKWTTRVRWHYGDTGCGKTTDAEAWLGPDHYPVMSNAKWWEGYDGHDAVLFDDFRKGRVQFDDLLRLLEKGQYRVECKNGSRQMLAKRIVITSQFSPEEMYEGGSENVAQLIDRLEAVIEYRGESWRRNKNPVITKTQHKMPPPDFL